MDFAKLSAPFDPAIVSWRVGSTTADKKKGMALAYIDARDVMERLDAVAGPANWQRRYPWSEGKRICCEIGIRIDGEWVWKSDGAGDTDVEAEKGAFSDAFKRAAVSWGIGRYLYDLASPWVELEPFGRSFKIKESELPKLRALLSKSAPPRQTQQPTKPAPQAPSRADATSYGVSTHDPQTVGDVLDGLPDPYAQWLAKFKRDYEAGDDTFRMGQWDREKANLAAYKANDPDGYKVLYDWMTRLAKTGKAA